MKLPEFADKFRKKGPKTGVKLDKI